MTLNLPYLRWGFQRLMAGASADIRTLAHDSWELHPAQSAEVPPAIHLEGALDKITGLSPWRTWDVEKLLIQGGSGTHGATRAYVIDDVMLSGGYLYKRATKSHPGYGEERIWMPDAGRGVHLVSAHLVSCYGGSRFFGPFIMDSLSLELLPPAQGRKITMPTNTYGHEAGYREVFDLPAPPCVRRGAVGQLTIYDDFGQNTGKTRRYRMLRDRARQTLTAKDGGGAGPAPVGIYLKRGATGESRILTNEAALEDRLVQLGFDVIEPACMDVAAIARRTFGAPIVVSVEGSHMSHTVYTMAEGAAFVVLQPPNRFAMAYKEFTDSIGLRFAFLVGTATSGGFDIDLDDLDKILDRLT
jgi:hypothetical protein